MIFHGQGELEQPPIVFRRRFDQRTRRAASDHLLDGRMTKGGQRRHKLHGLDDVGFPTAFGPTRTVKPPISGSSNESYDLKSLRLRRVNRNVIESAHHTDSQVHDA